MNPIEVVENALREHLLIRPQERAVATLQADQPIRLSGREAETAGRIAVDALNEAGLLAGEGQVVVSAEDLRTYLDRGKDLPAEVAALNRLRSALPERTDRS